MNQPAIDLMQSLIPQFWSQFNQFAQLEGKNLSNSTYQSQQNNSAINLWEGQELTPGMKHEACTTGNTTSRDYIDQQQLSPLDANTQPQQNQNQDSNYQHHRQLKIKQYQFNRLNEFTFIGISKYVLVCLQIILIHAVILYFKYMPYTSCTYLWFGLFHQIIMSSNFLLQTILERRQTPLRQYNFSKQDYQLMSNPLKYYKQLDERYQNFTRTTLLIYLACIVDFIVALNVLILHQFDDVDNDRLIIGACGNFVIVTLLMGFIILKYVKIVLEPKKKIYRLVQQIEQLQSRIIDPNQQHKQLASRNFRKLILL